MGSPERRNTPYSALPIHGGTVLIAPLPVEITPPARSAIPLHVDRTTEPSQLVTNPRVRPRASVPSLRSPAPLSPEHNPQDSRPVQPNRPKARRNRALEALDKLLEQEAISLAALEGGGVSSPPGHGSSQTPVDTELGSLQPVSLASPVPSASPKLTVKKSLERFNSRLSTQSLRKMASMDSFRSRSSPDRKEMNALAATKPPSTGTALNGNLVTKRDSHQDLMRNGAKNSPIPIYEKENVATKKHTSQQRHLGSAGPSEPSQKSTPTRKTVELSIKKSPNRKNAEPVQQTNQNTHMRLRLVGGHNTGDPKRAEIRPPELHTDRRIQERQQRVALQDSKELHKPRVPSLKQPTSIPTALMNPPLHQFRGSRSMGNLAAAKMSNVPTAHIPPHGHSSVASPVTSEKASHKPPAFRRRLPTHEPTQVKDLAPLRKPDIPAGFSGLPRSVSSGRLPNQGPARREHSLPLDLAPPTFGESRKSSPQTSPNHSPSSTPTADRPSSVRSLSSRLFRALRLPSSRLSNRSSRPATPSSHSALSRSTTDLFVDEDLEDWPEPVRLAPSNEVRKSLARLFAVGAPLVDIDPNLTTVPVDGHEALRYDQHLSPYEQQEVVEYSTTYFTGSPDLVKPSEHQFRDKDGNFQVVERDHIAYRYRVEAQLGVGSFGKVLKCRDYRTGRLVAVKVTAVRKELAGQAKVEAHLLGTLKKAGSPDEFHFVRVLDSFIFRGHMCIVTEMLGPNLYEVLKRNQYQGLPLSSVQFITKQLCQGLEFLDNQGIIHCDLKPENILVSDDINCQVKIIDFGSGCHEKKRVFTYIQSRFYRAPEILLGIPYSPAIDMWSLGCIVPELILGRPLFPGEDEKDQIALLCQTLGAPDIPFLMRCSRARHFFDSRGMPLSLRSPKGVIRRPPGYTPLTNFLPPNAANFVKQLLQWSPQRRLSAGGALYHEFLTNI